MKIKKEKMIKQPKVSVIVPIYNAEKYIHQCVDSILAQTLKDIEIILINDGSKDRSGKIIEEYAKNDSRIVSIHHPNRGYGFAVNYGIEVAKGDYIAIVESDDWIDPNMYEVLYKKAVETNVDIVKSNFFKYFSKKNLNKIYNIVPEDYANMVFCPIDRQKIFLSQSSIWSGIYRRDFLKQNDIKFLESPGASYQDTGFNCKALSRAKNIYLLEEAFLHYRQDNENSSVKSTGKIYCICEEWKEVERYLKENKIYEKLKYLLPQLKYKGYLWNFNRLNYPSDWQFLQIFYNEFKKLKKEKLLSEELLKDKKLSLLLKCKYLFYIKQKFCIADVRKFIFRFQRKNNEFLFQIIGFQVTNNKKKKPYLFSWRI